MVNFLLAIIYLAFISLGLPDALLGSAWPMMYQEFSVPISYAGIISAIISIGTVISSLNSDRLTRHLGAGKVTAISVLITAVSIFGFSFSHSFLPLVFWAIPYGLGAGSVDAALNNYVALHYKSRHMSWLHAMWGIGAASGPYIMGYALSSGGGWTSGYRYIAILQTVLTAILFISLPAWKGKRNETKEEKGKALSLKEIVKIKGAKEIMISFFCYCAIEQTSGLWASSYLVLYKGFNAESAAAFASMFFIGITAGRIISGFLTIKLNDDSMIRLGSALIGTGIILLFLPGMKEIALLAFILIGLGCAPIYPSIIHSTPVHFGPERSQAIIGVEMASAYIGNCLMPPFFGILANHISIALLPVYLLIILALMVIMHERLVRKAG